MWLLDETDQAILEAAQDGLPVSATPFADLAARLGVDEATVLDAFDRLLAAGVVRRIAAVPNHYRLGYTANGMSVWDVADDVVDEVGERVAALSFVSHCYRRPRRLPVWPYNLFAMVHGRSRDEVHARVAEIETVIGEAARAHDVLFSKRILKKTGVRLRKEPR